MHDQQHESSPFARQNGRSKLLQASLSCTPASRLCGVAAWHTLNLSPPSTVDGQRANCGGELRWWLLEACTDAMLRGDRLWRAGWRDAATCDVRRAILHTRLNHRQASSLDSAGVVFLVVVPLFFDF